MELSAGPLTLAELEAFTVYGYRLAAIDHLRLVWAGRVLGKVSMRYLVELEHELFLGWVPPESYPPQARYHAIVRVASELLESLNGTVFIRVCRRIVRSKVFVGPE